MRKAALCRLRGEFGQQRPFEATFHSISRAALRSKDCALARSSDQSKSEDNPRCQVRCLFNAIRTRHLAGCAITFSRRLIPDNHLFRHFRLSGTK